MLGTPVSELTVPVQVFGDVGAFGGLVQAKVHRADEPPPGYRFADGQWIGDRVAAEPLAGAVDEPVLGAEGADPPSAVPPGPELLVVAREVRDARLTMGTLEWDVSVPATVIGEQLEARGVGDPMPQAQAAAILDDATAALGGASMARRSPLGGDPLEDGLERRSQARFIYMAIGIFITLVIVAVIISIAADSSGT